MVEGRERSSTAEAVLAYELIETGFLVFKELTSGRMYCRAEVSPRTSQAAPDTYIVLIMAAECVPRVEGRNLHPVTAH